jgi:hypothetical protein
MYGSDQGPCTGAILRGGYTCAWAIDPRTGRIVASADCEKAYPNFVLPLPPGRYLIKLANGEQPSVEIQAGKWRRVGLVHAAPCPPIP